MKTEKEMIDMQKERIKKEAENEKQPVEVSACDTAPELFEAHKIRYDGYECALGLLADDIYQWANVQGFYTPGEERNFGEVIALMHSELSEALEAHRRPEARQSEKIPAFSEVEEEMADTIIRILDTCAHLRLDIGGAVKAKMIHNWQRPHKHGKKY